MLNKIIRFSLQNRLLVLVASVLLLVGGTYTAWHTEVDVFPDLNAPTVVVMTEAGGMAAEEVEQLTELRACAVCVRLPLRDSPWYGWSLIGTQIFIWRVRLCPKNWLRWERTCPIT